MTGMREEGEKEKEEGSIGKEGSTANGGDARDTAKADNKNLEGDGERRRAREIRDSHACPDRQRAPRIAGRARELSPSPATFSLPRSTRPPG